MPFGPLKPPEVAACNRRLNEIYAELETANKANDWDKLTGLEAERREIYCMLRNENPYGPGRLWMRD